MPDHFLRGILDANATYADAFAQSDPILLQKLAKGQSPRICWLGCSDSRVSAELSTGVAPGSIFVHRNIAQCFHPGDKSALAALTFAINALKVDSIIVCGHTGCGGVKAAMGEAIEETLAGGASPPSANVISEWIDPIKQLAKGHLAASATAVTFSCDAHPHEKFDPLSDYALGTLTDMHVAATVRAVAESDVVREAWAKGVNLQIHGWVYHVGTAKLQDLGIGLKGPGLPSDLIGTPATSAANSRRESIASGPDDKDEVEAK